MKCGPVCNISDWILVNLMAFKPSHLYWLCDSTCTIYTWWSSWLSNMKHVNQLVSGVVNSVFVGLRPVIQILCHVMARGWGHWLRYFTEAKAEVKYRASARIRGPKHDTRFEWLVSILIMTRYPFLPFKTHKTSAKNPCLLTIVGAIWFCHYHQCTPSQLWMHAPVAKERWLMT